jgi:hypothetical protein
LHQRDFRNAVLDFQKASELVRSFDKPTECYSNSAEGQRADAEAFYEANRESNRGSSSEDRSAVRAALLSARSVETTRPRAQAHSDRGTTGALTAYPASGRWGSCGRAQEPGDAHIRARLDEAQQGTSGLYFQQLLCGKELCVSARNAGDAMQQQVFAFAAQMANFVYIIADTHTREAVVVDAAWDVPGVLRVLKVRSPPALPLPSSYRLHLPSRPARLRHSIGNSCHHNAASKEPPPPARPWRPPRAHFPQPSGLQRRPPPWATQWSVAP